MSVGVHSLVPPGPAWQSGGKAVGDSTEMCEGLWPRPGLQLASSLCVLVCVCWQFLVFYLLFK